MKGNYYSSHFLGIINFAGGSQYNTISRWKIWKFSRYLLFFFGRLGNSLNCKSPVFTFSSIKEEYKYEYNLKNIQWVSFFKNVYLWVWNISAIHSLACLLSDATWCFSLSKLSFLTMPIENSLCLPRQMKYLHAELFQFFEDYKWLYVYLCF